VDRIADCPNRSRYPARRYAISESRGSIAFRTIFFL
jgi:hypothetical protein